ncbi:hypothetical protein FNF31_01906 [Cafeteria roenbergensis]|uniref:PAS domain-containing protein n=1 Tax=Cafeteria roenbergensis TaxID=33653 RepID=A0A5A8DNW7_CAFRO|nr:hypothetical protein FNF31_01906 [Cafeteria roenbergensis]
MLASSAASAGRLERGLAKVKGVFLQLLTLSLEQEATTSVSAVVASELLSWAQLISMPLGVTMTLSKNLNSPTPWALRPLLTALAVVNPDEIRDLLGNTAYVVVLAMSIAWTLMFVALLVGCMWELSKQNPNVPPIALRTFSSIAQLSATVLFEPMVAILMQGLACNSQGGWYGGSGVMCYDMVHVSLAVVIVPLLPIFFASSLAVVSVYLDRNPTSSDLDARSHGRSDVVLMVCKLALTSMLIFGEQLPAWVQCLALLGAGLGWMAAFVGWVPFANSLMNAMHGGMATSFLWATGAACIVWVSNGTQDPGLLIVMGTIPAGVLGALLTFSRLRILATWPDPRKLTSMHSINLWVRERLRLAEAIHAAVTDGSSSMGGVYVGGLTISHPALNGAATSSAQSQNRDPTQDSLTGVAQSERIAESAQEGIACLEREFSGNGLAQVLAAGAHSAGTDDGADFRERKALTEARKCSGALDIEFFFFDNASSTKKETSRDKAARRGGEKVGPAPSTPASSRGLSAVDAVLFEQHKRNALRAQAECQSTYLELLEHVESGELDIGFVHSSLASRLERAVRSAKTEVESMLRINEHSVEALQLASAVFSSMVGDSRRAATLAHRAAVIRETTHKARSKRLDDMPVFAVCPPDEGVVPEESNACVTISIDASRLGEITEANATARSMFGAPLVGANVRCVVPPPIDDVHDLFLRLYAASGSSRLIGKTRYVVGVHAHGHIFPARLALYELPPTINDAKPRVMAAMQPVLSSQGFLVISDDPEDGFRVRTACAKTHEFFGSSHSDLEAFALEAGEVFPALVMGVRSAQAAAAQAHELGAFEAHRSALLASGPAPPGRARRTSMLGKGIAMHGTDATSRTRRPVNALGSGRFLTGGAAAGVGLAPVAEEDGQGAAAAEGDGQGLARSQSHLALPTAPADGQAESTTPAKTTPLRRSSSMLVPQLGPVSQGGRAGADKASAASRMRAASDASLIMTPISGRGKDRMSFFRRAVIASSIIRLAIQRTELAAVRDHHLAAHPRSSPTAGKRASFSDGAGPESGLSQLMTHEPPKRVGRAGSVMSSKIGSVMTKSRLKPPPAPQDSTAALPSALRSALTTPFKCRMNAPPPSRFSTDVVSNADEVSSLGEDGLDFGGQGQGQVSGMSVADDDSTPSTQVRVRAFLLPRPPGAVNGGIVLAWSEVKLQRHMEGFGSKHSLAITDAGRWGKVKTAAKQQQVLSKWQGSKAGSRAASRAGSKAGSIGERPTLKSSVSLAVMQPAAARTTTNASEGGGRDGLHPSKRIVAKTGERIKNELMQTLQSMATRDSKGLQKARQLLLVSSLLLLLVGGGILAVFAFWRARALDNAIAVVELSSLVQAVSDAAHESGLLLGLFLASRAASAGMSSGVIAKTPVAELAAAAQAAGGAFDPEEHAQWPQVVNFSLVAQETKDLPELLHSVSTTSLAAVRIASPSMAAAFASATIVEIGSVPDHSTASVAEATVGTEPNALAGVDEMPAVSILDAVAAIVDASRAVRDALAEVPGLLQGETAPAVLDASAGVSSAAAAALQTLANPAAFQAIQHNRTIARLIGASDSAFSVAIDAQDETVWFQFVGGVSVLGSLLLLTTLAAIAATRAVYFEETSILRLMYLLPAQLIVPLKGRAAAALADHRRRLQSFAAADKDKSGGLGLQEDEDEAGAAEDAAIDVGVDCDGDGMSEAEGSVLGSRPGSARGFTTASKSSHRHHDPILGQALATAATDGMTKSVRKAEARWQQALRDYVAERFSGRTSLAIRVATAVQSDDTRRRSRARTRRRGPPRPSAIRSQGKEKRNSSLEMFMPGLGMLVGEGVHVSDSWCLGGRASLMAMVPAILAIGWAVLATFVHWNALGALAEAAGRASVIARAHTSLTVANTACTRISATALSEDGRREVLSQASNSLAVVQAAARLLIFGGTIDLRSVAELGAGSATAFGIPASDLSSDLNQLMNTNLCPHISSSVFYGAVPDTSCMAAQDGMLARGFVTSAARVKAACDASIDSAAYRTRLLAALEQDLPTLAQGGVPEYNVTATSQRLNQVLASAQGSTQVSMGLNQPWLLAALRAAMRMARTSAHAAVDDAAQMQATIAGIVVGTYAVLLVVGLLPRLRWLRRVIRASRLMLNVIPGEALLAVPVLGRAVKDLIRAEHIEALERSKHACCPRLMSCAREWGRRVRFILCCGICASATSSGSQMATPGPESAGSGASGYRMRVLSDDQRAVLKAAEGKSQGVAVSASAVSMQSSPVMNASEVDQERTLSKSSLPDLDRVKGRPPPPPSSGGSNRSNTRGSLGRPIPPAKPLRIPRDTGGAGSARSPLRREHSSTEAVDADSAGADLAPLLE